MKPFISCLGLSLSLTLFKMAVSEHFQSKTGHSVKQEPSSLLKRPEQPKDLSASSNVAADLKSTQRRISAFASGTVGVPVFNRQQSPIQEALARKAQLEPEQTTIKNKIALEVSKAHTSFTAIQRYETQLLPYPVAVVAKSRRAFEAEKTNILAAINAQQA